MLHFATNLLPKKNVYPGFGPWNSPSPGGGSASQQWPLCSQNFVDGGQGNNNPLNQIDWLELTSNYFAGWGDALTFGLTKYGRKWLGNGLGVGDANDVVDYSSGSYTTGWWTGIVNQAAIDGVGLFNGGARSAFYSGGARLPEETLEMARTFKGEGKLLEDTLGGKILNNLNKQLERRIGTQLSTKVWDISSAIFAANAKGEAVVFLRNPVAKSVWIRVEEPILIKRGISILRIPTGL